MRYLGVHLSLNPKTRWKDQANKLSATLQACLDSIHYKQLSIRQLQYVINQFVLPKITYAASHASFPTTSLSKLDTILRKFVRSYLDLPSNTPTAALYSPLSSWGFGLQSIQDASNISIVTGVRASLNDWALSNKWHAAIGSSPTYKGLNLFGLYVYV